MITITLPDGTNKQILLSLFPPLDGYDLQHKFVEFAASTDKSVRRAYTLEVLSYAVVATQADPIPLITGALIDNHLQTWQNVQKVFEAVLRKNGIDPDTHADKPHYWSNAGAEMAVAFIAEASKLITPMLNMVEQHKKDI